MNRGPQSVHLGGLFGYGLGDGEDRIDPSADKTYMSSGNILSFWTPNEPTKCARFDQKTAFRELKRRLQELSISASINWQVNLASQLQSAPRTWNYDSNLLTSFWKTNRTSVQQLFKLNSSNNRAEIAGTHKWSCNRMSIRRGTLNQRKSKHKKRKNLA